MGVAPKKIIFMVILYFEVALVSSHYNCYQKKVNKQVLENFGILQSIGIIAIKSRETRAVIYTCRYFLVDN